MAATKRKRTPKIHIRWAIRRDLPRIVEIERRRELHDGMWWHDPRVGDRILAPEMWHEERFVAALAMRRCAMHAAEVGDEVAGFVVWELNKPRIDVVKLVVAPEFRGRGVGAAILAKMVNKVVMHGREYMTIAMPTASPRGGTAPWSLKADPAWAASETVRLMAAADETPDLAVLADALQEAGCDDEVLLATFRRGGRMAEVVYGALRRGLRGEGKGYEGGELRWR